MKYLKQLSISFCLVRFSDSVLIGAVAALVSLVFLFTGTAMAQTATTGNGSSLAPWFGVWSIADDQSSTGTASNQKNTIEIRPTTDHRGLEIMRKTPNRPDVSEFVIPDGAKRPLNSQSCTGWQAFKYVSEAGSILGSSEVTCKESGTLETATLQTFVAPDRMIEILSVKTAGRTGVAVRHLQYERDLPSTTDSQASWVGVEERIPLSAPWTLDAIIQLSKSVDTQAMQAALMEKKVRLNLTQESLKQMQAAKLPKEIIDLTVALCFPDQFHIEKNGQVELRPWITSSPSAAPIPSQPQGLISYYPGSFYDCYSPQGYYYGFPYSGLLAPGSCWSYYSPFWWDYPIYLPVGGWGGGGGGGGGTGGAPARAMATIGGYVQIQPINTPRHAIQRPTWRPGEQGQGGSRTYPSAPGYSGGSAASAGGSSAASSSGGGGVSAPSASPGGYSSGGGGGGGTAVPK